MNRKGKGINNKKKELQGLEDQEDSLSVALKKVLNSKTPGHDGIHRFWI